MSQLSNDQITKLYNRALQFQNQQKWQDALDIHTQLLEALPRSAEVHFQVGNIFLTGNKFERAVFHLQIASTEKPNEAGIWDVFTNALICSKDAQLIKASLQRLQKADIPVKYKTIFRKKLKNKNDGNVVNTKGIDTATLTKIQTLLNKGMFKEAESLAKSAAIKNPASAPVFHLLARSQDKSGDFDAAKLNYKKAISLDPNFAIAYTHLAELEFNTFKDSKTAMEYNKKALILAPYSTEIISNIASILETTSNLIEAEYLLNNAVEADPKNQKLLLSLKSFYSRQNDHSKAVSIMQTGINKNAKNALLYLEMGISYAANGETQKAEDCFDKALNIDAKMASAYYRKSLLKLEEGEIDQASDLINSALELDPKNPTFLRGYVNTKKITADDPIIDQMISLYDTNLQHNEKAELGFSIVKALEDSKQYDRVFKHLKDVNDSVFAESGYNNASQVDELNEIKDVFSDFNITQYKGLGYEDTAPIFVCGLPRSGTTLVEQIISSHSKLDNAGELGYSYESAVHLIKQQNRSKLPLRFNKDQLQALGREIDEKQRKLHPDSINITDKSIQTYRLMGLIKAAMPNCKIIVVRRDPRDNLLSIYRNKFVDGTHLYAYDLKTLGEFYNIFIQTLDFWRQKMPDDFYEIQYEKLTSNTEEESRKLIDFCGLDWEDSCLDFHKSKNRVKTLSIVQVRQPIYKSSVKAWQRYEEHLQPMFDALKEGGNYPTDD